jgi:hypothetical protein
VGTFSITASTPSPLSLMFRAMTYPNLHPQRGELTTQIARLPTRLEH